MIVHINREIEDTGKREHFAMEVTKETFMLYLENLVEIIEMKGFVEYFSVEQMRKDEIKIFIHEKY